MTDQPLPGNIRTRVLPADSPGAIDAALATLRDGRLVVFPTDTVYGVGCDPRDPAAIAALYRAKERPLEMAIPVLLSTGQHLNQVSRCVPAELHALAERFWPGALTIIVPRSPDLPGILTAGGDTVAVRVPDHPTARALIEAAGGALAVTSANRSGQPAPQTAQEALADLDGRVDLVLDGGACPGGVASSI
ncbi:MAG: L-threonylcarbamoyladenylate synthase, partial [Anaerolineae bacterium]